MSQNESNSDSVIRKGRAARLNYIKRLVRDGRIYSIDELKSLLAESNYVCKLPTLKKDLKDLGIKRNTTTKKFGFVDDIVNEVNLISKNMHIPVMEILRQSKIHINGLYKIYPPFRYGGSSIHSLFIDCVMITCPIGYEELLYQAIFSNFTSYEIITAQLNKGSVSFLFESNDQKSYENATNFYEDLKMHL